MNKLLSIIKNIELKMYFLSTVFFILLIISALAVYYDTKMEERNFFDIVEKHSYNITEKITPQIISFLKYNSVNDGNIIGKKITANKEIIFYKILSNDNKALLSNNEEDKGEQFLQPEIQQVDKTLHTFTRVYIDNQNKRIFEVTTPIFSDTKPEMIGKLILGLSMDEIHLVVNATRYKLIALGFSLFMLGGAGILFNISYYSYRNVQNALENIKSYTNSILLSMDVGVIATDLTGKISIVNNAIKIILGTENLIDKNIFEIFSIEPNITKIFREALENFRGMKTIEIEYNTQEKINKFLRLTTSILKNNINTIIGLVVLIEDVTELKELEKHVYRADKVSALGRLASGIAHEIKNPLSAMNINVQLLEEEIVNKEDLDYEFRDKLMHYINIINSETERLEEIIKNFIDFTKTNGIKKEPVSLDKIVKQVINLIGPEADRRKVKIQQKTDIPDNGLMICDRNKIKQLLLNLVINSLQAMPEGGLLKISIVLNTPYTIIEIEDTGIGIKKEYQDKIFDLYYTSKKSGSGLGLSICQHIVEEHNGTVEFVSDYGKGTKFTIKLPLEIKY
ncbi:PAS domain S-box protein [Candidatus Poribacteria bacterium]|nr:PAS domain S-box protein [Candidatus Poribacteria bacterium]